MALSCITVEPIDTLDASVRLALALDLSEVHLL
jgi:hypothetical protein